MPKEIRKEERMVQCLRECYNLAADPFSAIVCCYHCGEGVVWSIAERLRIENINQMLNSIGSVWKNNPSTIQFVGRFGGGALIAGGVYSAVSNALSLRICRVAHNCLAIGAGIAVVYLANSMTPYS